MLTLRAEGTDIARRSVDEPVADHLVFPLEPFAAFGARAVRLGAVMRTILRVHVGVRARAPVSFGGKDQAVTGVWKLT